MVIVHSYVSLPEGIILEHIKNSWRPLWLMNGKSPMRTDISLIPQIYPLRSHVGCTWHWVSVQQAWLSLMVLPPMVVDFVSGSEPSYDILRPGLRLWKLYAQKSIVTTCHNCRNHGYQVSRWTEAVVWSSSVSSSWATHQHGHSQDRYSG